MFASIFTRRALFAAHVVIAATASASAAVGRLGAQDTAFDVKRHYVKRDHMAPMRDGVRLFTIVYEPPDTTRS
jgi:predicted acyl esterase